MMACRVVGMVQDSCIDTFVWPDTCAAAERLWSAGPETNPKAYDVA